MITVRPSGISIWRRVPAAVGHIGLPRPRLVERVERVDAASAPRTSRRLSRCRRGCRRVTSTRPSARNEVPEHQMLTGSPVAGSIGGSTRLNASAPVPFDGSHSTAHASFAVGDHVGLVRVRVPQHLAGRQHRRVDPHHRDREATIPAATHLRRNRSPDAVQPKTARQARSARTCAGDARGATRHARPRARGPAPSSPTPAAVPR